MARKKGGHAGGHGWFVTFADLMGLLMSFFVMLTASSTQNDDKMQIVTGSMRDAFGTQRENRFAGIVEIDGIPVGKQLKNSRVERPDKASDRPAPGEQDNGENISRSNSFMLAAASLRQAFQDLPEITQLSKSIFVEEDKEGLNIKIVDQEERAMFPEGSSEPYAYAQKAFLKIAEQILKMPNSVKIIGYTASQNKGAKEASVGVWELSTERALAVYKIFKYAGLSPKRFSSVIGKGDTEPLFSTNPYVAINNRVSIILEYAPPPVPAGY